MTRTCLPVTTWALWLGITAMINLVVPRSVEAQPARPGNAAPPKMTVEDFERRVRPLLARHCYECHSSETGPENGELILDTAAGIRRGGTRGPLWVKSDFDASLLGQAVSYRNPDLEMPPAGKLKPDEIATLRTWITSGAPLPAGTSEPVRRSNGIDFDEGRRFWSFQPVGPDEVPNVKRTDWPRNAIDRFVLARLEAQGLAPSPPAERHVQLRRLHFDLTGLPPTPVELHEYLANESPLAWDTQVERLLSSPHYGERWGRAWLDLARYTDTTATWLKSTGQAYLYRDWVVRALNENRPFDEFVRLQLAGDLRPDTPPEDLAALGFLGLSPTYWKELRLAPDVIRQVVAEEWDERIDAVSRTFLGLTVSCARCHDHKFDPISMEDYYGLAGVFASTQLDDRVLLPEPRAELVRTAHSQVKSLQDQLAKIKDKQSEEAVKLRQQMNQIRRATPDFDAPVAHVVKESSIYVMAQGEDQTRLDYRDGEPRDLNIFRRGNPANPGDRVPRRFLTVLSSSDTPASFSQGSGRLELAEALTHDAQGLLARVIVNRLWAQHFGNGLVRTTSNFGVQGEQPTHPELLEYLAWQLVEHQWDLKWLHRLIVSSATYQQSSRQHPAGHRIDPENRLLWRMNRRRLDVEMWRDALLTATGALHRQIGGAPVELEQAENRRRTLYAKVARRELHQMLRMYDFPEPTAHSPRREPTTTPLQQLYVLNSPLFEQQATQLLHATAHIQEPGERIAECYLRLFGRVPTAEELDLGVSFVSAAKTSNAAGGPSKSAETEQHWQDYVHALMGLNEFFFVD